MRRDILAVISGAIVLFIWGFVSWTILPWHNTVANKFIDEEIVSEVLKINTARPGVYYLPFAAKDHRAGEAAAFVNVLPDGFDMNMEKLMTSAIIGQLMAALLVLLLLRSTSGLSYWNRVFFIAMLGLTIGFVGHFPYWNWFGFSTPYIVVAVLDSLIAWFLAGLVMAWLVDDQMI